MFMLEQRIQQQFFDSADLKYAAAEVLSKPIADAVEAVVGCITAGGKVLVCGNGGSAADSRGRSRLTSLRCTPVSRLTRLSVRAFGSASKSRRCESASASAV